MSLGFGAFDQSIQTNYSGGSTFITAGPLTPAATGEWAILANAYINSGTEVFPGYTVLAAGLTIAPLPTASTVSLTSAVDTTTGYNSNLVLFAGPSFSLTALVQTVTVLTNVATVAFTAPISFINGTQVAFDSVSSATFLNGNTYKIISTAGSSVTFAIVSADYGPTANTGNVTNLPYLQTNAINYFNNPFPHSLSFPNPVTAGNTILVSVLSVNPNDFTSFDTVSDGTNTYTLTHAGNTVTNATGFGGYSHLAWAQSIAAGSPSVTVTSGSQAGTPNGIFTIFELPAGVPFSFVPQIGAFLVGF